MVTIKRYIGKIRKPLHWKGRKAFLRFAVLPALLAVALLLAVRMMVVTQYEMPYNRYDLDLLQGDRLAVNRLAYGWATPLPRLFRRTPRWRSACRKRVTSWLSPVRRATTRCSLSAWWPCRAIPSWWRLLLRDGREMVRRFVVCKGYGQFGNYIRAPALHHRPRLRHHLFRGPQAPFYRCFRRERFLLKTDD